ncbi:MAG: phospholipase C, phosphocholine-specific [Gemmataceae bacterium]|nr:phospholipase C, phosphocholine-specific [Gemmataceae bacterium]
MPTRRQFLRAAAAGSSAGLLASISRAAGIAPEPGSSVFDAEHVVILMQENRSFDHTFGSLRGVRGFNDPRAVKLPDGNPVWVQIHPDGKKYVPFRLDIRESKSTWMGSLPHSWSDQVDAANGGKHDRWLDVKRSGDSRYAGLPLTLGFHTREDIPFYYALADAFTVCDQNFCSTLTGTTPNRLHLWTGTIRATPDAPALVRNSDCDYGQWVRWTTFPERLEDHGISWKIYQNELTVPSGLSKEADAWLANFGDNPIEWFTQYHVRHAANHRKYLEKRVAELPGEIAAVQKQLDDQPANPLKVKARLAELTATLARLRADRDAFSPEKFEQLSPREKSLHARAFCTNTGDPHYRELADIEYTEGKNTRRVKVPRGDILYQFRADVQAGRLPAVSWIVPPERLSDHPTSAWYGQWCLSEILNILTTNPKVWQKTVFILTYDENDGYFDHVPPFQAPHPDRPETGRASPGIDTRPEWVELEADRKHAPKSAVRGNAMGLGFRVPMIIASPWSRGGCVCSQVFDHTSVLQFLETLMSRKLNRKIEETNITRWRRTVCGDLTSAFQPAGDPSPGLDGFLVRDTHVADIHRAQFKPVPTGFHALSDAEVEAISKDPRSSVMPRQEPGTRRSCPLPYELACDGVLSANGDRFGIRLEAGNARFGPRSAGAAFIAYASTVRGMEVRHYTVAAGANVEDDWLIADFPRGHYLVRVHGPNGFFREFAGSADKSVEIRLRDRVVDGTATGGVEMCLRGLDRRKPVAFTIRDESYGHAELRGLVTRGSEQVMVVETPASQGWYDACVRLNDVPGFAWRYAGRVETGRWSISDPKM